MAAIPISTSCSSSRPASATRKKREALLYKIQQLTIDRAMFAPIMDLRALIGVGPRITKHTITDVWMRPSRPTRTWRSRVRACCVGAQPSIGLSV